MFDKALFGAVVVTSTSIYILLKVATAIQHARKAKSLGCEPCEVRLTRDPVGILQLRRSLAAMKEKQLPNFFVDEFARVSEEAGRPVTTAIVARPFFQQAIFTTDPKNIQTILATNFKDFELTSGRKVNFSPLLGHGIFAADGKLWEHSRALMRPQFVRSQISDVTLEERHVQAMMQILDRSKAAHGWTELVDIQPLFFRLTIDSATEFLFGESVNSQLGLNPNDTFAQDFDKAQRLIAVAGRFGSLYWMKHNKDFFDTAKKVHDYIDYFVQKALTRSGDEKEDPERYTFLGGLSGATTDPVELRSQLLNILLAGRDTTASTLSWFISIMANATNKNIYKKLRTQILEEFGTYSQPREITFERLKQSQYLQWCINETLRLYPIVPLNGRGAVKDTVLPNGGGKDGKSPLYVKAGTEIAYSVHVMHRNKDLWGPDADDFIPERWSKRRPGWEYLPFNGGPRICIGQQFALTEIAYVLVRLIQRVDEIDGSQVGPVTHGLSLTNCPGDGVSVRLHLDE